jgi:lysozyme
MKVTPALVAFLKEQETGGVMVNGKLKLLPRGQPALVAYPDHGGVWTISWGVTGPEVKKGTTWSFDECRAAFACKVEVFECGVNRLLAGCRTTQNQFDAMVSFAYNCGLGALGKSTLLKKHKAGDYAGAAAEFKRWTSGGLAGLVTRRRIEALVYLDGSFA